MISKQMHIKILGLVFTAAFSLLPLGCSKTDDTASVTAATPTLAGGLTATEPTAITMKIADGISTAGTGTDAGTGMGIGFRSQVAKKNLQSLFKADSTEDLEARCDEHGYPKALTGEDADLEGRLSSSNPEYAFRHFYCMMAYDSGSPETIQGSIKGNLGIMCLLEKGVGFTFDGEAHTADLNTAVHDTALMTECGVDFGDDDDSLEMIANSTWTVTASKPADFNPNFDSSVKIAGTNSGQTIFEFRLAFKVTEDYLAMVSSDGNESEHSLNGMFAMLNLSTGNLYFDAKFDRLASTDNGWSRRINIASKLEVNDGSVVGIEDIHGIYTDAQSNDSGPYGTIETASGSLTDGIKFHSLNANPTEVSGLLTPSNYSENTSNSGAHAYDTCYSSDNSGTCTGNTGLDLTGVTSLDFMLITDGSHQNVFTWTETINPATYVDTSTVSF